MTRPQVTIENFDIETELACKCCGMFNMTDRHLISIQALRYMLGVPLSGTSHCRCLEHNKEVGGVHKFVQGFLITSNHECERKPAEASDLYSEYVTCQKIYDTAVNSKLFTEVIYYKKKGIVHVSSNPKKKKPYYAIV